MSNKTIIEAEAALISLLLHQPELITEVEPYIKPSDVKEYKHSQLLFESTTELIKQGNLSKEKLIEVVNANATESDTLDKTKLIERYYNVDFNVDRLDGYISLILTGQDLSKYFIRNQLSEYKREVERNKNIPIDERVFRSSLTDLNKIIGGSYRGELSILGGRPAQGKTAASLQFNREFAKPARKTAYIGLEMTAFRQIDRMLVSAADTLLFEEIIELSFAKDPIKEKDWLRAFSELHKDEIYIVTSDKENNFSDYKQLRKLILDFIKLGVRFFTIDSLNLLFWSESNQKRNYELEAVLADLSKICTNKDYDYPHIQVVAHLNRECEQRQNKRPIKSDLKDTGGAEQWSDLVKLLYRDEYYNPDTEAKNVAEFIIEKNRNRPFPAVARVFWDGAKFQFRNLQQDYLI